MDILISMIPATLLVAAPIIVAALGGMICERSGIVNIALEGIMLVGAFAGATACYFLESHAVLGPYAGWISLGIGLVAGIIFSLLLAVSTINFKADHTIAGTAINLLSVGLSVYMCQIIFGQQRSQAFMTGLNKMKDVPIFGDLFANIYPTIFIALILVVVSYYVVFKTGFGLRLRSCGENPQASASMGINVYKTRYMGVLLSGAFAGLAGAMMVLTNGVQFTATSIHGVGFIAIAAVIFGKWNPFGILGAGIFFGLSSAIGIYASMIPVLNLLPPEFFACIPYVLTIVALVLFSNKTVGPKAAGQIYDVGQR